MQPLEIVLYGVLVHELDTTLRRKLAVPADIVKFKENAPRAALAAAFAEANVVIALSYRDMPAAPRLRLLQAPGAGLDQIALDQVPQQAFVCNAYGHHVAGAEYAVLGMLAWSHDLIEAHESFRSGSWRMSGRCGAPLHQELSGKTVGILGYGPIGEKTAELAKAFGTRVIACNRTVRPSAHVDRMYPLTQLHEFLGECDFVVVSIALAPQTVDLIDAKAFAAMKPGAVIVNVARGAVINEDALYHALAQRRIAGGVIDAWYRYPTPDDLTVPPSKHPFHELPNVIMTPHSSIWTQGMIERRWDEIARNIEAIARGETPSNIVRRPVTQGSNPAG
ncbi:MAG TPA: 2-hydroxyacid dehydrogenase [Povalibacter sp.]|nr:2-hydroxyacid dehydrogenase [Povalibacter sp.]